MVNPNKNSKKIPSYHQIDSLGQNQKWPLYQSQMDYHLNIDELLDALTLVYAIVQDCAGFCFQASLIGRRVDLQLNFKDEVPFWQRKSVFVTDNRIS